MNPMRSVKAILNHLSQPVRLTAAAGVLLAATALPSLAVHPQQWVHGTEADFLTGQTEQTVVTNLGDVKLSPSTQPLGDMPEHASVIYDLQVLPNGDLYVAAGPEATLLRQRDGELQVVTTLANEQVFALARSGEGQLLVAISGQTGSRLAVLSEQDELVDVARLDDVRYIWDMIVAKQAVYLATGTEGQVFRVNLDQRDQQGLAGVDLLLNAAQANILSLARDRQGRLFAGSDTDGLIYRITFNEVGEPEVFVVFDAPEPEIGALLVMPDGTLYAGTSDAQQARPGRLERAVEAESGRPVPMPSDEPVDDQAPEPGDLPDVPPEPEPIEQGEPAAGGDDDSDSQPQPEVLDDQAPAIDADDILGQEPTDPQQVQALARQLAELDAAAAELEQAQANAQDAQAAQQVQASRQQLDALRQVIRQRLEVARNSGVLQVQGAQAMQQRQARPRPTRPVQQQQQAQQAARQGNAIYRISRDGFVTEVFRESVMILRLVAVDQRLLIATGNEGHLFSLDPGTEETTILADLEPQQISAVLSSADGHLLLGTTNPASLIRLDAGMAEQGTYTSPALDASQISLWGRLHLTAHIPAETAIAVETRSGNVQDPDLGGWSPWTQPWVIGHDPQVDPLYPREVQVDAPPARFFQYRLRLTGPGTQTPVVDRVALSYVMPNMPPRITAIQIADPARAPQQPQQRQANRPQQPAGDPFPDPQPRLPIQWEATDPNNDRLVYSLEYRMAGSDRWLLLAEDLEQNRFEWDTRRVPDGRYVVRVTASDAPDNPPGMALQATRSSNPVLVDNSPPRFDSLDVQVDGRTARITGQVTDALSLIGALQFAVNATDQWQTVLPDDLIFDSTQEAFTITIPDLAPGQHVVTLRARDVQHNATYHAVVVEVH